MVATAPSLLRNREYQAREKPREVMEKQEKTRNSSPGAANMLP